eukprot:scaffold92943_cov72-Cyclotella_meneghiniana.AAC.4
MPPVRNGSRRNSTLGIQNQYGNDPAAALISLGLLLLMQHHPHHLIHYEAYDKPVYASDPLPITANSKLRASPLSLFTNPRILALKQHVVIAMRWESHYKYFSPASEIKSLDVKVDNMPQKFEDMLDRRQMAGPLSLDQIARAVEGPCIIAIANDIAALRRVIQENGVARANNNTPQASTSVNPLTQQPLARLQRQYQHPD